MSPALQESRCRSIIRLGCTCSRVWVPRALPVDKRYDERRECRYAFPGAWYCVCHKPEQQGAGHNSENEEEQSTCEGLAVAFRYSAKQDVGGPRRYGAKQDVGAPGLPSCKVDQAAGEKKQRQDREMDGSLWRRVSFWSYCPLTILNPPNAAL
jgi:hypothetical protein